MVSFRDKFATDFGSIKRVKKLTQEFEDAKPEEFKLIQKRMERFKLKNTEL